MSGVNAIHFAENHSHSTLLKPPVGWMYDLTQSYEPAFYMAGACTFLAVCLLFLIPFLLPPEVMEKWYERSKGFQSRMASTDSSYASKTTTGTGLDTESSKDHVYDETKKDFVAHGDLKKSFTKSMECILKEYFSMRQVVTWEDCVLLKVFVSGEDISEVLATSRETYI